MEIIPFDRRFFSDRSLGIRFSALRCRIGGFVFLLWLFRLFLPPPAHADDTLAAIKQRGVLRWGADAEGGAPYVFPDPNNPQQLTGFEFDLATALASELGVRAEMVQNSWDGLVPALQRGNFDIILNGLELTPDHEQQIAMTRPYFAYAQQIVTRKDATNMVTLEQLHGKRVGVLAASVAQRLLEKQGDADVRIYPGNVEGFRDLNNDRIDATVLDLPIATYYLKFEPNLKCAGPPFSPGYYAIGVRHEDKALLAALDHAIAKLFVSGELERIYRRYGLWNEFQQQLGSYKAEVIADVPAKRSSTIHEWPKYLPMLLKGAVVTIQISVTSMVLAMVIGLAIVLMRLYGAAPLRWFATAYVEVIRGTPLLIQLYLIYYGLPNLGIRLSAFVAALVGLGLNYAASEAENYRAGIQAIPRGQMEAALALGMSRSQALRRVILPQAFRLIIPPVNNDFIALFKDSSLVSVITMVELTKVYGMLATSTYDYIGLGLLTAAIYFSLSYPASIMADRLERKLCYDHR